MPLSYWSIDSSVVCFFAWWMPGLMFLCMDLWLDDGWMGRSLDGSPDYWIIRCIDGWWVSEKMAGDRKLWIKNWHQNQPFIWRVLSARHWWPTGLFMSSLMKHSVAWFQSRWEQEGKGHTWTGEIEETCSLKTVVQECVAGWKGR